MLIAFDIDGTLKNLDDTPNYDLIGVLKWFKKNNDNIMVWSGGGVDYVHRWVTKLGLPVDIVCAKTKENSIKYRPDICFDDEIVSLARINIKIIPDKCGQTTTLCGKLDI